jgi:hypothetical protein
MSAQVERPASVPANASLITLPCSEVCMFMHIAGDQMWVEPVNVHMAQLYDLGGRKFSFPISRGEAGMLVANH